MMIYIVIVVSGVLLMVINIFSWRKQSDSFNAVKNEQPVQSGVSVKLGRFFSEWMQYFRGYHNEKAIRNSVIMFAIFTGAMFVNSSWTHFNWPLLILATVALIFWGQIYFGRITNRKVFDNSFPEIISVVNAAVSSGSSIHHALDRCGKDVSGPLGAEFHLIGRRLNLGEDAEVVFNDAYQRFKYKEFYFFIIVMLVSIQRGGQLRVLMARLARVLAGTKAIERKKMSMTSEARMSAKIVAAIPLLFFIGMKFMSPENFNYIIDDPTGQYILYYVLASEALGLGIIWILVKRAT
ncbi:type II secretion system F family protein [Budvicia diplopodorum]|uniref:type II secretion system F family protein n=1 Tax=Budvicia diplopodorum TaxID=1119056 RepID=UPI00135A619F|nr:type II secretion system F family protein [Budvicia diplopodorum]